MDHRDDHFDRFGSLVFSLPGGLAHARLLDDGRQRFLLPAHVPDQYFLRGRIYCGVDRGHPVLALFGADGLTLLRGGNAPVRDAPKQIVMPGKLANS